MIWLQPLGQLFAPGNNSSLSRLFADARGVTAIEYGLIASLIAVAMVVAITTVGTDLSNVFNTVATDL